MQSSHEIALNAIEFAKFIPHVSGEKKKKFTENYLEGMIL